MASGNEDLFAYGYDAENYGKPAGHQGGYWGGDQGELAYDPETNRYQEVRPTGVQQDVGRYREMGQGMANRSAYRGNYNNFNAAGSGFRYGQGRAVGAMDLQQAAAEGRAPSAAEIAGKAAIDQSLTAQQSAAASTRGGPLAQAAASRAASNGANAFRQTAVQGIQAGRANEMANARNSYAGSTFQFGQNQLGMGQLELGRVGQEQQADLFQRQLNQQGQQWAENKAFDTKSQGLASDFARTGQQYQQLQGERQQNLAERQQDFNELTGSINTGNSTGSAVGSLGKSGSGSDVRMKRPVEHNPYGDSDSIDLDEESYDSDEWERRRDAESRDIFRGDPYDDKTNAMLDDRQRQNGQQQPANWLNAYIEKDQAPPPAAGRPKPKMSYEAGWDDTSRDDADRGEAPGTSDFRKYASGNDQSFEYGTSPENTPSVSLQKRDDGVSVYAPSVSDERAKDVYSDKKAKSVDEDPKFDWDAEDRKAAEEPRRKSAERTFRRDTSADQKKVRRTFEDKAGKDADDMMAGMQASLAQGASTGGKAAGTRADRVAVDLDESEDGRMVYSDEKAKEEAFREGVKLGQMKPEKAAADARAGGPADSAVSTAAVDTKDRKTFDRSVVGAGEKRRSGINAATLSAAAVGPLGALPYIADMPSRADVEKERGQAIPSAAQQLPPGESRPDAPARAPLLDAPRYTRAQRRDIEYSDERTKTEAAHALEGHDYAYKDEFTPPEQKRGEVNHGPMAQAMEKNPLTRTAVKKDPRGMRMVDMNKLVKVHSSLIDHLQDEIEELKGERYG